ncbi:hypothetical protein UlMin_002511 [Ulmus minor]
MISRVQTAKPRKSFKHGSYGCSRSISISDYEDCIVGFMEDLPLIHCGHVHDKISSRGDRSCWAHLSLKDVLRASVGVLGESPLGMTEKVVLLEGRICVLKRFRKVSVGKSEFGRRIERLAMISQKCKHLVPLTAYLYAKRIKFVLSDYFPMGSLADLLAGGRHHGNTALDWNQRLTIIHHIAQAIAFIHSQSPTQERLMQMNVHGNVKASNVMINTDFSACLSDYGVSQLAQQVQLVPDNTWQRKPPALPLVPSHVYSDGLGQKCDIYNFGVIILEILAGPQAIVLKDFMIDSKASIREGCFEFFEFSVIDGKERKQASQVLGIALACTNKSPEGRPPMDNILLYLEGICNFNG